MRPEEPISQALGERRRVPEIMSEKEKFHGLGRGASAGQKRNQQLEQWERSVTNKEPSYISTKRKRPKVKFGESVIFLAASQSGDIDEVDRLLTEEKADINSVNKDGLTALHQCCIDDDYEMVQLLVRRGANLNVHDNEGWTPLHAAASCGHDHIVSHLLDNGAFPAPVNNEGDTPEDLSEDDDIRDIITDAILKQGVSVTDAKTEEETLMLADANRLKNDPSITPGVVPGGATILHVSAAKNYLQVMEVLLSLQSIANNIDSRDEDGWTPLHAAVYWENMEAAAMLARKGADVNLVTKTGDTIDDLCRPEYDDQLEELKQLSENMRTRNRCYAMNHKRPALLHQSSRDDVNSGGGGGKPSPTTGHRRRSSRDRAMFPKIDMASEKAIIENWTPEEVADGNRLPEAEGDIEIFEETSEKNATSEENEHSENNLKEVVNSLKDKEMVAEATQQVSMPTSKPPLPPGSSPQSSPQVQPRTEQSQNNGRLTSPQASPKIGKKRPISGNMLKRLGLWEQQSTTNLNPPPPASVPSPVGSASSSPQHTRQTTPDQQNKTEPKRFPFVHKTVTANLMAQPSSSSAKRNSFDETRLVSSLNDDIISIKTSSLPRNTRMRLSDTQTTQTTSVAADDTEVATEAMPTQSVSTEVGTARGGEGAKVEVSHELSRAESVESIRSERSFTEESETNRKRRAKKTRETRKKTQPVPADFLEQLSLMEKSATAESEKTSDVVKEEVERERKEFVEQLKSSNTETSTSSSTTAFTTKQSAFRPLVRPASKVTATETTPTTPEIQSTPEIKTESVADDDDEGSGKRPRTKSAVRRKPREQRKPTGIIQFDPGSDEMKNASEEVIKLFSNKSSTSSPEPMSLTGPKSMSLLTASSGSEDVTPLKHELTQLRHTYGKANEEILGLKGKVSELSRRLEDATRAYQQERREKEDKDHQINQLMSEAKTRDELKVENQRLKDENSALIRVIGKLSRAPIRPAS